MIQNVLLFLCQLHGKVPCNRQAGQEILRAARAGELPEAEVMKIITPRGREVYNKNALRSGHKTLEEHERQGGFGGVSIPEGEEKRGQQSAQVEATSDVIETPVLRCRATYALNEHGQEAGAREKGVSFRECGSTRWIWEAHEKCYICAVCWTPARREE